MNVVILDDDAAFLRSAEILLSHHGHRVMAFTDPDDACIFLKLRTDVNVLVLDYVLPELTGAEFLQQVKSYLPRDCQVILISGHTDLIDPIDLDAIGVGVFLPKPLDFDQLCRLVGSEIGF